MGDLQHEAKRALRRRENPGRVAWRTATAVLCRQQPAFEHQALQHRPVLPTSSWTSITGHQLGIMSMLCDHRPTSPRPNPSSPRTHEPLKKTHGRNIGASSGANQRPIIEDRFHLKMRPRTHVGLPVNY